MKQKIEIFTDGAAQGNPGKGGYGILMRFGQKEKELSAGYRYTTNNRMELLAVIVGLENLKTDKYDVVICSDSKYVVDSVEKGWVFSWEKKGFDKKKNVDLWKRYLPLHRKFKPRFVWIKGHAGHIENERCDVLAVNAANSNFLLVDEYFERSENEQALFD